MQLEKVSLRGGATGCGEGGALVDGVARVKGCGEGGALIDGVPE